MGDYEDRTALLDLMANYATIPDTKGWDLIPEVFTSPLTWDFSSAGGGTSTLTHEDLRNRLSVAFAGFSATHHAITNHLITLDGDRAHVRAHIEAQHWVPPELVAPSTETCWHLIGFYDDEAVRTPDGWRLSVVKLTVRHHTGQQVFAASMGEGQRQAALA